jgi:preprotein translocase subunit SecD
MLVVSRWRVILTFVVCVLGLLFAFPSALDQSAFDKLPHFLQKTVSLGLELRGGSHLQLEIDIKTVEKERQEEILSEARKQLRKNNIKYNRISLQTKGEDSVILVDLKDAKDFEDAKKIFAKIEKLLIVMQNGNELQVAISKEFWESFEKRVVGESIEIIRRRIDESGTKEPTILRQGDSRIVAQLPGVENPEEVKRLLGKTALLTFHVVDEDMKPIIPRDGEENVYLPTKPGVVYLPEERKKHSSTRLRARRGRAEEKNSVIYVPIKKHASLTGKSLVDAQLTVDSETGFPCVSLKFDKIEGTKKMAEMSSRCLKKQFAMVLDGKVLSAPVFQSVIANGRAQITGDFTMEEANELALLLRAGSLPAPLKVVEERTIGPSLGADSISDGKTATVVAFILVSLFMVLSYGKFGGISVVSLTCNVILLFAGLTILGATLTLPGIAGIALTIGMAVDANVLIYERMREEIRNGIRPFVAISQGYKMAITTILDSNITTLVGAMVLYWFGSGPIRGFAVTLALGTGISLFTTFSLTKSIIAFWLRKNRKADAIVI